MKKKKKVSKQNYRKKEKHGLNISGKILFFPRCGAKPHEKGQKRIDPTIVSLWQFYLFFPFVFLTCFCWKDFTKATVTRWWLSSVTVVNLEGYSKRSYVDRNV